jgi:predicted O-methyltransferase YrrM
MSYVSHQVTGTVQSDVIIQAPLILNLRAALWDTWLGGRVDTLTSDPATLDILSMLIRHLEARVVVEAGTYRGWGTFTMAETLRTYAIPGHVWTCDPQDYEIQEVLDGMELADYVTYSQERFEDMLERIPERSIDVAYIDASDAGEENLRLRYLSLVMPQLRVGGLVVMDDCAGGWQGADCVRQLANLYLPLHRGCAVLQKTR